MFMLAFLGVGSALLAYEWTKARDARDYAAIRALAASTPTTPIAKPSTLSDPLLSTPFGPAAPAKPASPPPAPTPSFPVRLTDATLSPKQGKLYLVTVVVHFPLSLGVSASSVQDEARNHGFTDALAQKGRPAGWPGASGDYYVAGHYAGGPTTMARSYAGGQVQITDVWET